MLNLLEPASAEIFIYLLITPGSFGMCLGSSNTGGGSVKDWFDLVDHLTQVSGCQVSTHAHATENQCTGHTGHSGVIGCNLRLICAYNYCVSTIKNYSRISNMFDIQFIHLLTIFESIFVESVKMYSRIFVSNF